MAFDLGRGGITRHTFDHPRFGRCEAAFNPFSLKPVGDLAVPKRILFRGRIGGDGPVLEMGVELVNDRPECTFVQIQSDSTSSVYAMHLKAIPVERLVTDIVNQCSQPLIARSGSSFASAIRPAEPQRRRTVEKMQRRRRNPDDTELLQRVAAIYKANPGAPRKAVAEELGMSTETAGRWAKRCTELGLLPPTQGRGHKRK